MRHRVHPSIWLPVTGPTRPSTERPYILFPIGYPASDAEVPDLRRKPLSDALVIYPPGT